MRWQCSPMLRAGARWFALLCMLAPCTAGAAPKVYRCTAGRAPPVYQDRPCADPARQQLVEFAPAPVAEAVTDPVANASPRKQGAPRASGRKARSVRPVQSFECRAANGELFYRHARCPGSIPAGAAGRRAARGSASRVGVRATPLPRREACRRIESGARSGRAGRERDETVTTYERNLGRDPCRRF